MVEWRSDVHLMPPKPLAHRHVVVGEKLLNPWEEYQNAYFYFPSPFGSSNFAVPARSSVAVDLVHQPKFASKFSDKIEYGK